MIRLAVALLAAGCAAAQTCPDLVPYICKITLHDPLRPAETGPEGYGGGFFLSEDGMFLTAYHLFQESPHAVHVEVEIHDGPDWVRRPVEAITAFSRRLDFVIARVRLGSVRVKAPPLARHVRAGEGVTGFWIRGPFRDGSGFRCTEGRVSGVTEREIAIRGERFLLPGSSGAPIFNGAGEAVAIAEEMVNWNPKSAADWSYTGLPVATALSQPKLASPLPLAQFMQRVRRNAAGK